jgi:alpha-L-fucosidase 2
VESVRSLPRLAAAICLTAICLTASAGTTRDDGAHVLWYDEPATDWEKEALPIGNGRIGAMISAAST